jgi:hypothetical protein
MDIPSTEDDQKKNNINQTMPFYQELMQSDFARKIRFTLDDRRLRQ